MAYDFTDDDKAALIELLRDTIAATVTGAKAPRIRVGIALTKEAGTLAKPG